MASQMMSTSRMQMTMPRASRVGQATLPVRCRSAVVLPSRHRKSIIQPVMCQASQQTAVVEVATPETAAPSPVVPEAGKVCVFDAPQFDSLMAASNGRLVVVDVFTTWCGPCKMIAPELEKMAEDFGDKMIMAKIDCTSNNDNKSWAKAQNVKALPTFILFKDGQRINDMTGAKAANLRKLIETHM